ncbi:polyketide cyclase [Gordonia sp. HNM0687]|uniref:Polyketide cyclase n=1 Tax=Gordonia mangrovi TaxID=2665643 RepID=A0A6L7GL92_9ACTN|nr:SRPBCC family protein [Gordonia mangrovi]MXP20659.1 polyketide cyclase [Gordonia mangrovi]UVF78763.1 SRPBCC family protein [Gordonia mangrovi]
MTIIPTPTGRHRSRPEGDAVEFTRTYRASIQDVWAAVTESDRLARWIGFYSGDPREGHVQFTMNAEGEDNMIPVRYDIRRCEPPRILQIHATDDFGTWDLVVELTEDRGITTLTLAEIVNDPSMIENTGPGWEYYLDRLIAAMDGTDPAAIDFDDYYPTQQEYYRRIQRAITDSAASSS